MVTSAGSCSRLVRPQRRAVAGVEAAYYAPTALAPFVSRRAFERVTGPKSEWWLVLTVSTLVGSVAAALGLAAREDPGPESAVLGVGCALTLGLIDVIYAGRGRISPVYLVDAAVELPLAAAWMLAERERRCAKSES